VLLFGQGSVVKRVAPLGAKPKGSGSPIPLG
jgi:hypothetical protein